MGANAMEMGFFSVIAAEWWQLQKKQQSAIVSACTIE